MEESCCTCATLLKNVLPQYDEKSEKPKALDRRLDCCGRVICGNCIVDNSRFATYCKTISRSYTSITTDMTQVLSVKYRRLQLPYLKDYATLHPTLHHPQNPRHSLKIRQHTPTSYLPIPHSRTHRPRHQKKAQVRSKKMYCIS